MGHRHPIVAALYDRFCVWRRIAANCHVNRATVRLLQESGFEVQEMRRIADRGPWGNSFVAGSAHMHIARAAVS